MKSSLSSSKPCRFALVLALLFVVSPSCLSRRTTPFHDDQHDHLRHHHQDQDQDHDHLDQRHSPCESFSHEKPRSVCEQFHRSINHRPPPPPLPPPPPAEIDPIYGVDKRLVPSGPNPLHN